MCFFPALEAPGSLRELITTTPFLPCSQALPALCLEPAALSRGWDDYICPPYRRGN